MAVETNLYNHKQVKMKLYYDVELITSQTFADGEDFTMYRGYMDKNEALTVASALSKFFPYHKYPTQILVNEYNLVGKTLLNKRTIKRYRLKDENGRVVKGLLSKNRIAF
jgi:hypothetical protein